MKTFPVSQPQSALAASFSFYSSWLPRPCTRLIPLRTPKTI